MATDTEAPSGDEAGPEDEAESGGAVEGEATYLDLASDQRKWLLAIHRTVATAYLDDQLPDGPVRTAYNRFLRAAFDRMARICRSDIVERE